MIFYLEKSASSHNFKEALVEELKASRPKSPVPVEQSSDKIFCNYIVNLMSEIPQNKKRKLLGELVKSILRVIDD